GPEAMRLTSYKFNEIFACSSVQSLVDLVEIFVSCSTLLPRYTSSMDAMAPTAQANQFDDFWEKASRKHQERVDELGKAKFKNKLKKSSPRGNNHEVEQAKKIIPPTSLEELKERLETENNSFT